MAADRWRTAANETRDSVNASRRYCAADALHNFVGEIRALDPAAIATNRTQENGDHE